MLRNLLRWARITKAGSDDKQFAVQQVEYNGKVADSLMVFPYGLHANLPPDSLALMFAVQCNADNRAAIAWTPKKRPKLASGEVAFYHPLLPDLIIKMQANGEMLIKSGIKINIEAPETEFTSDVNIIGNLDISGTVTNATKDIGSTHRHSQGNDSNGDAEVDIVGVL